MVKITWISRAKKYFAYNFHSGCLQMKYNLIFYLTKKTMKFGHGFCWALRSCYPYALRLVRLHCVNRITRSYLIRILKHHVLIYVLYETLDITLYVRSFNMKFSASVCTRVWRLQNIKWACFHVMIILCTTRMGIPSTFVCDSQVLCFVIELIPAEDNQV